MILMLKKLKKLPQGAKASIAFLFSNVVTSGIAYITIPFYTRILTTEEYGQVNVVLTWTHIFGIIAMFCLSFGVFNNGMIDYPDKRDSYSFSMLVLSNLFTILFAVILFAVYPFVGKVIGLNYTLLTLMIATFLLKPAYNFWTARQRYEYKYKYVVLWTILNAVLSPAVAILICLMHEPGDRLYSRLFGAESVPLVMAACFYIYLGRNSRFSVDRNFWKSAILFNLPLIPHYLSYYILNSSDKIMISQLVGDSETAYYSVAYSAAAVVSIVWSAVNGSLIPYTYEKCSIKDYKSISNVTLPILTLFAVICIFAIVLAPEVVAVMATNAYTDAIYVIPPIVAGTFFQVQYFIYANIVYYFKKPKYVMYASVTAAIANIILNYFFIQEFGYKAAGYTTLICYMTQAVLDYFAMRYVVKEKVYNMKFISFLSVAVVLISLLSLLLYSYPFIRYGFAFLIVVILFYRRKFIVQSILATRKPQTV